MAFLPDYQGYLPHLFGHSKLEDLELFCDGFNELKGEPRKQSGPLGLLSNYYLAKCLAEWVQIGDLNEVKRLAFASAKADRMAAQFDPSRAFAFGFFRLFAALLSDEPKVRHWKMWELIPVMRQSKGREPDFMQPQKGEYHSFNCHLALMGEIEWLKERSEKVLELLDTDQIKLQLGKSYKFDYQYFVALANGDVQGMEANINELLKGRVASKRNNEHGLVYQSKVVSGWGFMLSKIAYIHGYELNIDNPWVPKEWLPIKPLGHYETGIDFLDEFDIFTPYGRNTKYFKNAIDLSPIALDKPQVSIREWVDKIERGF